MRLWSLHPRYLDPKGLVALWREGLLAQAVLRGQTRGYKSHPQLKRFLASSDPIQQIAAYLGVVQAEATRRSYAFDATKIGVADARESLEVTEGQLAYEWAHLLSKLEARSPSLRLQLNEAERPEPHPSFQVVPGGIAEWEIVP